jgi:L-aminopeptidase/D-esterase-like protein
MYDAITDVAAITVNHATDQEGITGCTVIPCEGGAVGGVDVCADPPQIPVKPIYCAR